MDVWRYKDDVYRGKDCMKNVSNSLREHEMKTITFKRKKMILLMRNKFESYFNQANFHISKNCLKINILLIKNFVKLGTLVITQVNTEVLHKVYVI